MTAEQALQVLNELGSLLLAFGTGCYAFRKMNGFFRFIFLQLSIWLLFYGSSYAVTSYQRSYGLEPNNQWLMNIHLLLETGILLWAAAFYLQRKAERMLLVAAYVGFLTVVGISIWTTGPYVYFNDADVTECLIMTIVYTYVLYRLIWGSRERTRTEKAAMIVCIGLLVYFACSVPLIALLHYMQQHDPETGSYLFTLIIDVTANLRYLLVAVAFLMVGTTIEKNQRS